MAVSGVTACILILIIISVDGELRLEPSYSPIIRNEGTNVAIYCINSDTSSTAHQPEWVVPIGISSNVSIEEDLDIKETKLVIIGFMSVDSGMYTCRAGNMTISTLFSASVDGELSLEPSHSPIIRNEGTNVAIYCINSDTSSTSHQPEWVVPTGISSNVSIEEDLDLKVTKLVIIGFMSVDSGMYICRAGTMTISTLLSASVDGELRLEPNHSPIIRNEGTNVAIYCINSDTSSTADQPEWIVPIGISSNVSIEEDLDLKETKLLIIGLMSMDSGMYTCRAGNMTISTIISVSVGEITFPNQAEEWQQTFRENMPVTVKCTVYGDRMPTIEWYKDNQRIVEDGRFTVDDEVGLNIINITRRDMGDYICRAIDRSLSTHKSLNIFVNVQGVPTSPTITSPEVSEFPCQIILQWTEPEDDGGLEITSYLIRYSTTQFDATFYKEKPISPRYRYHTISNLQANSYYYVTLFARNRLGDGRSRQLRMKTGEEGINVTTENIKHLASNMETQSPTASGSYLLLSRLIAICSTIVSVVVIF